MSDLDVRLAALRAAGWQLRRVYTLKRLDGDEVESFYGDELETVIRRAEACDNEAPRRSKPSAVSTDPAMARRLASSKVHTGLVSTTTYNK